MYVRLGRRLGVGCMSMDCGAQGKASTILSLYPWHEVKVYGNTTRWRCRLSLFWSNDLNHATMNDRESRLEKLWRGSSRHELPVLLSQSQSLLWLSQSSFHSACSLTFFLSRSQSTLPAVWLGDCNFIGVWHQGSAPAPAGLFRPRPGSDHTPYESATKSPHSDGVWSPNWYHKIDKQFF